jgi:cardiolipin synthase A/B
MLPGRLHGRALYCTSIIIVPLIDAIIGIVVLGYGLVSGVHALMTKQDPRSSLGWAVVSLLVPVLGATLYWFLGVNRIQTKARRWQQHGRFSLSQGRDYGDAQASLAAEHPERAETLSALIRISDRVTRKPLLRGNEVEPLFNGEQAYGPMIEAIGDAEKSVYLCTYLFETDEPGMRFIDALGAAAARGVDVRVMVDAIGERYGAGRARASKLLGRRQGVKVARFLPLTLSLRGLRVNLRNHRKLLIVDSKVGFTGGMNIGGRNMVEDPDNGHATADLHFRVTGPVVYAMEETFFEDWYFSTGEQPEWNDDDATPVAMPGDAMCRAISDGPNEDYEVLTWILVGALSVARERIQIMTPYFIPSRELLSALNAAVLRGVRVDIVLPTRNNLPFVAWASQAMLGEVLRYGSNVYYQREPFNHSKLLIVDEFYVLVGSANLDPRSLQLNFEFNLEVYDANLAAELSRRFDQALAEAQPVTIAALEQRNFLIKLRDSVARLFAPYL